MLRRKGRIASPKRPFRTVLLADVLAYCASALSILFTLDQVRLIWIDHNAAGVSLIAWMCYALASCVWLFYGYVHRDRVLLTVHSLWLIMNSAVAIGAFVYR